MDCFFFIFDGMIEDDAEPIFANVQFGYLIVLDNLQDQVVGPVEDRFEAIIFIFFVFVDLFQDHLTH